MALLGREFIAVPDDRKGQIVFKWPDVSIRKSTRAIVDGDQVALFLNTGKVVGTIGPGRHRLDTDELPFLGAFIDFATGGNAYRAELFFVGTREYAGMTFGGRIDDIQDPQTGMIVTLRVFGEYSLKVLEPADLIVNLVGTVDVTDNQQIAGWVSGQLLKVLRTHLTTQLVRNGWPILGLSAYTPEIEQTIIPLANEQLATYGLSLVRMGNFDINLADADEAQLKTLAKDTAYTRLAGGFNDYARGEMALGAGAGMAKGGSADGGAFLAAGMGLGNQAYASGQSSAPLPPPAPGFAGGGSGFSPSGGQPAAPASAESAPTTACPHCSAQCPATARFCPSCGQALAPQLQTCSSCGEQVAAGSRFCSSCGLALGAPTAQSAPPASDGEPPAVEPGTESGNS